jgi:catechol 2,3-dioxygenase-like lactoylglutathione lyase family enzyme
MPTLSRIVLYVRDVEETVAFYEKHFGFEALRLAGDRIIELLCPEGGASIMVHLAGKAVKFGQATVKLSFHVDDVEAFCAKCAGEGLQFGPLHHADGYVYANARDPSKNPISVSSRPLRKAG